MAFLLTPFCRCAASLSNEARCEDAENNDVTIQDGDALPALLPLEAPEHEALEKTDVPDEKASDHSTVDPSSQEGHSTEPSSQSEEKTKEPTPSSEAKDEASEKPAEVAVAAPPEKAKRPPEPLTTLAESNFDDRGVSSLEESKKFSYTIGNDYKCQLAGWTHTRPYAKGFIRNKPGTASAVVSGLDPHVPYLWKVYQVAKLHGSTNGLSVNGEDQGKTSASKSHEATASGKTLADKDGQISFQFTRDGEEVHLSGLAVAREEEKEGKPKAKAKAKVKAKPKKKGGPGPKYDELGRRIDRQKKVSDSSSDEELLEDLCPSSRRDADFERELKRMKKKVREGMTPQQREEMANPWLHTQISDSERQLKKDMFKSFYREQYARLKKSAGPDLKQYEKKDPSTGETNMATSGLKAEGGHRPLPRPKGLKMPKDFRKDVGRISQKDLVDKYSCQGERMLISVYGDLFDVSDRPDKYGADGPYWYMTGKDITWALVSGEDTEEQMDKFYDLFKIQPAESADRYMTGKDITWALVSGEDTEEQMDKFYDLFKIQPAESADRRLQGLMSWWAFYEKEYGQPVGRHSGYDKEWGLPAPPHIQDGCSVM